MGVLDTLTNGGLAVLSVLAVAAFLQAAWTIWFGPRWERTPAGSLLPGLLSPGPRERMRGYVDAAEAAFTQKRLPHTAPLVAAARLLLGPTASWLAIQGHLLRYVNQLDGGAQRWIAFLVKTAPQLGLAGTLVGVSGGLAHFAADPSSTHLIIESFAFAITTTLWGVGIAVLGMCTSRLMWQPYLERVYALAEQQATHVLHQSVQPLTKRIRHAGTEPRRARGRRR